jgi:hypothetical protein
MRIRSDLVGVVYAHLGDGVVRLTAGGPLPDGAEVGEHLTDAEADSGGEGSDAVTGDPAPEVTEVGEDLTDPDAQADSGGEGSDADSGHHRRRVRTPRATTDN